MLHNCLGLSLCQSVYLSCCIWTELIGIWTDFLCFHSFIAITGSLWMGARCSSGVWVKDCFWLKDHEVGMDVCNWLVFLHKNASQKLLWFRHHSLSSERPFIICDFLLRSAPHPFLNHIPWSKERCPRKDGNPKKCWTAPSFPETLFLHGEILQIFRIVFCHQNNIHTLLCISEAEYQDIEGGLSCCRLWMCVWGAQHAVTKDRLHYSLAGDPGYTITVCHVQYACFWKLSGQWKSETRNCHFERAESNWNLPEAGSPEDYVLPLLQQLNSQCTRLKCHITARVSGNYVCSNEKSVLQTWLFSVGFCFLAFLNLILCLWIKLKFVLHEFQKQGSNIQQQRQHTKSQEIAVPSWLCHWFTAVWF